MNPPNLDLPKQCTDALPRDSGGRVFSEPWQAQAFALAVRLSEAGYFSWKEWSEVFGAELKAACDRGEPWIDAYLQTPHGQPVELRRSEPEQDRF